MEYVLKIFLITVVLLLKDSKQDNYTDENRPYEFSFTILGEQHRYEKKDVQGIIQGEFGFITGDGVYHVTVYATDENGSFKILSMRNAKISGPLDQGGLAIKSVQNQSLYNFTGGLQIKKENNVYKIDLSQTYKPQTTPKYEFTTRAPVGPFQLSTLSTIRPGCGGCGIVTRPTTPKPTSKPFHGSFFKGPPSKSVSSGISTSKLPISEAIKFFTDQPKETVVVKQPSTPYYNGIPSEVTKPKESPYSVFTPVNNRIVDKEITVPVLIGEPKVPSQTFFTASPSPPSIFNKVVSSQPQYTQTTTKRPATFATYPISQNANQIYDNPKTLSPVFPHNNQVITKKEITPQQKDQYISELKPENGSIFIPGNDPIKIQDKYPGMHDGLPAGITEKDIVGLLYKFNYTVGFHGHYEKGWRNGTKIGGYFVNGRDGYSRVVKYVADENGYRPSFKLIWLGLDSQDTPNPDSEKKFGLKNFEFVWYPIK